MSADELLNKDITHKNQLCHGMAVCLTSYYNTTNCTVSALAS